VHSTRSVTIEQATVPIIQENLLRHALERLRHAEPLGDTPLRRLILVHRQIEQQGEFSSQLDFDLAVGDLLASAIINGLTRLRDIHGIASSTSSDRAHVVSLLHQDFSHNNTEMEAWSALYHRYICLDLNLQMQELARLLNLDPRQLRRRLDHGIRRLAETLSRRESEARQADHQLWLKLKLPPPSYGQLYGRDSLLADIISLLDDHPPHTILLTGPGGVGKTSLAHAVTSRLIDCERFSEFAWVTLDHPLDYSGLIREIAGGIFAYQINCLGQDTLEPSLKLRLGSERALVVIDNADFIEDLAGVLSRLDALVAPGRLIVIARQNPITPFPVAVVAVTPLPSAEFRQMLEDFARRRRLSQVSHLGSDAVTRIELVTGRNPFAARLLLSYLDRLPFDRALETLGNLSANKDETLFDRLYGSAWAALSTEERQVMLTFLTIPPEGAQHHDLLRIIGLDREDLDRVLASLITHSFVDFEPSLGTYSIHPLLRSFLEEVARTPQSQPWFHEILARTTENAARSSDANLVPRTLSLLEPTAAESLDPQMIISLIRQASPFAHHEGRWSLWYSALARLNKVIAQETEAAAVISAECGIALRWLGNKQSARDALVKAVEIYGMLGDFVSQAEILLEVGQLEQSEANLTAAFEAFQRAAALAQRSALTDLRRFALNGLSSLLLDLGQPEQALALGKEALNLTRSDLPDGQTLSNLSMVYLKLGEYSLALNMAQQALSFFEEVSDYPRQARANLRLGMIYQADHQSELALKHLKLALGMMRSLGDALGQSRLLNNLGVVHFSINQFDDALSTWRDAIALQSQIGDEIGMAYTWHNLGDLMEHLGREQESVEAFQMAAALAQRLHLPVLSAQLMPYLDDESLRQLWPPQSSES
jgi:tetratricopeptide (TPR) repeat protein